MCKICVEVGVLVGLINYYYDGKDVLVVEVYLVVIGCVMCLFCGVIDIVLGGVCLWFLVFFEVFFFVELFDL